MVSGELLAHKAGRVARLMEPLASAVRSAEVVVPCCDLQATMDFFLERLGFRLEVIFPADAPSTAVICGHGVTLRLVLTTLAKAWARRAGGRWCGRDRGR